MSTTCCEVAVLQSAFWQTNTAIITDPDGSIVLIDPGVLPHELQAIARRVEEGRLIASLSTHEDWDHVLWTHKLGQEAPRLAHPETVRILTGHRETLLASLTEAEQDLGVTWDHALVGRLDPIPGVSIRLGDHISVETYPTPGHTAGHTSLWLEREDVLIAGDMLSDVDPPILTEAPDVIGAYRASLDTLADLVAQAHQVIAGHGTPCDREEAARRLERDRRYLDIVTGVIDRKGLQDIETLARAAAERMNDPRIDWDEGWRAHTMNIGAILRYA